MFRHVAVASCLRMRSDGGLCAEVGRVSRSGRVQNTNTFCWSVWFRLAILDVEGHAGNNNIILLFPA